MGVVWDGIVRAATLNPDLLVTRQALADAARKYRWGDVIALLRQHNELVNTTRPDGTSFYAPLHQAAHGGASREVVQELLGLGAWRTLENSRGERPVDIAEKHGHSHLLGLLTPELKRQVPLGVLLKIQAHFHSVIRERAREMVEEQGLRLPELTMLLELEDTRVWFAVPGMYGGFSFWLQSDGVEAKLVSESWCRVVDGSGQRHEITSAGSALVAEGFV